jgi:hypothetical protein
MKPNRMLRWYPRAWRERYGDELLALLQDTVDEGRPTWRLRLSVAWGGLRERGHQWRVAAVAAVKRPDWSFRWSLALIAGLVVAVLPFDLTESSPPARAGRAAVALDAVLATVALTGVVMLAGAIAALPALVRFLRAGGWAKVRRRVGWAMGATVLAVAALTGLTIVCRSHTIAQLDGSWIWLADLVATGLAVAVAIGLWATAAAAAARHLTLTPRARATQLLFGAMTPPAVMAMIVTTSIWWWAVHSSALVLVVALVNVPTASVAAQIRIKLAIREGKRLRSAR